LNQRIFVAIGEQEEKKEGRGDSHADGMSRDNDGMCPEGGTGTEPTAEFVGFDVGGKVMRATTRTLRKDPRCLLSRMLDDPHVLDEEDWILIRCVESHEREDRRDRYLYEVDCNPACFGVVLDHLRYGAVHVPPHLIDGVRRTAEALHLASLVSLCVDETECAACTSSRATPSLRRFRRRLVITTRMTRATGARDRLRRDSSRRASCWYLRCGPHARPSGVDLGARATLFLYYSFPFLYTFYGGPRKNAKGHKNKIKPKKKKESVQGRRGGSSIGGAACLFRSLPRCGPMRKRRSFTFCFHKNRAR
jgi:hypothetical protein